MTQYTPGPWTIRGNQHKTKTVSHRNEDGTFDEVCSVPGAFMGEETMLANARLISAAPELLLALKELVAAHGTSGHGMSRNSSGELVAEPRCLLCAHALAVIAKAGGS